MTPTELFDSKLSGAGWKKSILTNTPGLDARYTYQHNNLHIKLDLRLKSDTLWLWYVNGRDRDCLGFPYGNDLAKVLDVITSKQNQLSHYMTDYFDFQKAGEVQIMCWEQFSDAYSDFEEDALSDRIASGQNAREEVNSLNSDQLDVEVFPGEKVAKLSDYVNIMKKMQTGDMNGALQPYGLDIMSWGSVASAWGMKLASDPVLTEKFSKMLMK